jgi:hypothetical protein
MAHLANQQLKFIKQMEIPMSRVFDATGMRKSEYEPVMRNLGMWVAYGVTPCNSESHTLRTRSGHCVQCSPANLSYLRRHDESGEVYIAKSDKTGLIKIGLSQNAHERVANLNGYQYGGCSDWKVVKILSCESAGRVESNAHQLLSAYAMNATYYKNGRDIDCRELFSCSLAQALAALEKAAITSTKLH